MGSRCVFSPTAIEISNDLCLLMKKIDSKHFTKLKESKIHYILYVINIDKTGKPLNFNFVYDYPCRRYFDLTIINYLKKLNYKAAYIKKKYICYKTKIAIEIH